jgi:hypothetical protein
VSVYDDDGTGPQQPAALPVVRRAQPALPAAVEGPLDVAVGAAVVISRPVVGAADAVIRSFAPVAQSLWALALRPPLVPEQLTAGHAIDRLSERGRTVRLAAGQDVVALSDDTLDLLVPEILTRVLDRIDLTSLVLQRVDLERVATELLAQLDLTGVVLEQVDLHAVVTKAIDELDLTEVVLQNVDLGSVVEAALDSMDLNEVVRTRVDVAGLAEEVIDEVDLPDIIRDSTSGVATVVVDGARISAVSADELVNRWIDRIMLRRKARRTDAPGEPESMLRGGGDG